MYVYIYIYICIYVWLSPPLYLEKVEVVFYSSSMSSMLPYIIGAQGLLKCIEGKRTESDLQDDIHRHYLNSPLPTINSSHCPRLGVSMSPGTGAGTGAGAGSSEFQESVASLTSECVLAATCSLLCFPENLTQSPQTRKPNNSRRLTYGGSGLVSFQTRAIIQPHAPLSQRVLSLMAQYDITVGIPRVQPMCLLLKSLLWVIHLLPFPAAALVSCSDSQCSRKLLYDSSRIEEESRVINQRVWRQGFKGAGFPNGLFCPISIFSGASHSLEVQAWCHMFQITH